jgi:hypothetical protein
MQLLIPTATPHRFTVAEYMALEIAERTELLEGVIYDVSPRNEAHRRAIRELSRALIPGLLGSGYVVQTENAVAVPEWQGRDAPEIDVAVLADKVYRPGPTAADAFAFFEVSHTTYALDRKYKIPLYVSAGVPSWIVNIPLRQVEFYGSPRDLEREHGHTFSERDTFEILGIAIPVAALFDQCDRPDSESA